MLKNLCQKMFRRSLWVYHANSGGCNGCDIEVLNALTPYYDVERFGIKLVGSPRHADVMLCQGPALSNGLPDQFLEAISFRMPLPGRTNSGRMKSAAAGDVSRTMPRSTVCPRKRRMRVTGNWETDSDMVEPPVNIIHQG